MKKKFITFLILIPLLVTSCSEEEKILKKYYETTKSTSWSIEITLNYSSYIKWINSSELSSEIWWKINYIWVEIWDNVRAWDLIARVDSDEANTSYKTNSDILESMYSLKNSIDESYNAKIDSLKNSLEKAKAWLSWTKLSVENTKQTNLSQIIIYDNEIEKSSSSLETEKEVLKQINNLYTIKINDTYKSWENTITSSVILYTNIINYIDSILWVTETYKDLNDSFEDYLWAKNIWTYEEAKEYFIQTNKKFSSFKDFYKKNIEWKQNIEKEIIISWLSQWENLSVDMKQLLRQTHDLLNFSIENINLSSEIITNYQNTLWSYGNQIENTLLSISWEYKTWLKWTIETINLLKAEAEKEIEIQNKKITGAEKTLEIAKNNLENIKNVSKSSIDKINTESDIAKLNIDEINSEIIALEKDKKAKLSEIDSNINSIKWNSNSALVNINNSKIYAPFDWVISGKYFSLAETVNPGIPILKIDDRSKLKIEISIPYFLADKIKVNDKVVIIPEWKEKKYIWFVSRIPSLRNEETKKTLIEIVIWNGNDLNIWTFARVEFNKNATSGIIIPNSAIVSKYLSMWVMTINWNKAEYKQIEIIDSNDNFSVVKWIQVWETIITTWKENIWDWELLN